MSTRKLTCVKQSCAHTAVIPTPTHQPHCPKCGSPVRLEVVAEVETTVTADPGTGDNQQVA